MSRASEVFHRGVDFFAGGAEGGAGVGERGFDEEHGGVEREGRGVGCGDVPDDGGLGGVAFAAEDLADDRGALGAKAAARG